jgi:hypothetical protein
VVGLDGVIRSSIDPGQEWIAEQSGVDNDRSRSGPTARC